jgi:hypothetical protein
VARVMPETAAFGNALAVEPLKCPIGYANGYKVLPHKRLCHPDGRPGIPESPFEAIACIYAGMMSGSA